ncbi:Retrovirus-related Pol polyprotein from transposon 17.6 [Dictyocoela muelleri]|nr:Retrovirus-related Pol polyprotein from transposon 17.6 [Dictyocoela muelleri]
MLELYECVKTNKIVDDTHKKIETMKTLISNALPLKLPNFYKTFIIYTDASNLALGAVLTQKYNDYNCPIFFYSRKFSNAEINYTTTEKECLAIISAIKHWKHYLSNKFIIMTDHQALLWLSKNMDISQRLIRWIFFLQEFIYEINYIRGKQNILADSASRYSFTLRELTDQDLSSNEKISIIGKAHEDTGHSCKEVTNIHL